MTPEFSEGYFAAVARASQDVMRILNMDGVVEYMNEHGLELLEIDRFDANQGRAWQDLWPSKSRGVLIAALNRARNGDAAEFTAYCREVPRFGPRLRTWKEADTLAADPALFWRTVGDGALFFVSIPLMEALEYLQIAADLPALLYVP